MPDDPRCHPLSWFEIPLCDLARAETLYGHAPGHACRRPGDARGSVALPGLPDALDAFGGMIVGKAGGTVVLARA